MGARLYRFCIANRLPPAAVPWFDCLAMQNHEEYGT